MEYNGIHHKQFDIWGCLKLALDPSILSGLRTDGIFMMIKHLMEWGTLCSNKEFHMLNINTKPELVNVRATYSLLSL